MIISFASCGGRTTDICGEMISIAGFTTQFAQGLENFSESEYSQLRVETSTVRNLVNQIAIEHPESVEASELTKSMNIFISAMDVVQWDLSVALSDGDAVSAAANLGSSATLTQANTVESLVIDVCGLPSTVEVDGQIVDTLPPPSIASPTQTDPPTNTINEQSEDAALGATVAALFRLNLSATQNLCLGAALQGIVDVSSGSANLAQYQSQFQKAFDSCSIDFTVPLE